MAFFESITPGIEISLIAVMVYYFLSFFWNTRSMDLVLGSLAFLLIFGASSLLHLPILHRIMLFIANFAVIAILIIFQPELRLVLSKMSLKGKRYKGIAEFDVFLDQLTVSVYRLADRRIGALIVLENEDSLEEYAEKAVRINAQFSSELLESIFAHGTPLHDGATIIRGSTILAAAAILPLAEDSSQLTRSMGTRHRAGLGTSQMTDALVIVISEEAGKVSIARDGIMTRGVKIDRFKGILRSVFSQPTKESRKTPFTFLEWLRQ